MTTSPPQSPLTSTVPAPPQGPGAVVPFAAPPRDPDKSSRMAVGIIVTITALVLVCGGAGAAAVGVLVWSSNELAAQSTDAADEFLQDIVDDRYDEAYESLCKPAREQISRSDFTRDWEELAVVEAETAVIKSNEQDLVVRAEVTQADGTVGEIDLTVVLGQQSMTMQVCGWEAVQ